MKKISSALLFSLALLTANNSWAGDSMIITSPDVAEKTMMSEKNIFNGFGCTGGNVTPHLIIKNVPAKAKSLAITMYDPDAPTGSGWWHWLVYNIAPDKTDFAASDAKVSKSKQFGNKVAFGKNDFGTTEYGGPCPPVGSGKHRYIFTAYALSVAKLDLPKDASAAMIGFNLNANTIERTSLTAYYQR